MILNEVIMCATALTEEMQELHRNLGTAEQGELTAAEKLELKEFMLVRLAEFNSEKSTIQQDIVHKLRQM